MAVLTQGLLVVRCLNVYVKTIDTPPAKTQTSGYGDYKVLLVAYSVLKSVLVLLLSHGSGNTARGPCYGRDYWVRRQSNTCADEPRGRTNAGSIRESVQDVQYLLSFLGANRESATC